MTPNIDTSKINIDSYRKFNEKIKSGEYVINNDYADMFGTIKYYLSETNVMISCNDYNCLSDIQKKKCKPQYK